MKENDPQDSKDQSRGNASYQKKHQPNVLNSSRQEKGDRTTTKVSSAGESIPMTTVTTTEHDCHSSPNSTNCSSSSPSSELESSGQGLDIVRVEL